MSAIFSFLCVLSAPSHYHFGFFPALIYGMRKMSRCRGHVIPAPPNQWEAMLTVSILCSTDIYASII